MVFPILCITKHYYRETLSYERGAKLCERRAMLC